jgi:serine/threonine-protein kinase
MGELFLGHQPALDRLVVLKTLRRDFASNEELVERFQREACLAASVHHQNVVAVYDCFSHRGKQYIALECVDGLDLRSILQRAGRLPARVSALIALECARGIEAIHARGMVHRDIKPANILIGRQGETKIADFGIALDPAASPLTQTGVALGSPPYMSPEQLQGARVDARSDVFALGAVLYELLTGRPPYNLSGDPDQETLLARMKRESYAPLRKAIPESPRYLRGLVRSCLRTNPKRRLGSITEMRVRLERRLGRPTTTDAREEIAACLWDRGLFQIRDGETIISRVSRRRPGSRSARIRWIGVGFVMAAVLAVLGTVVVQQRAILRELASTFPQELPAPADVLEAIGTASAQLRSPEESGGEVGGKSEDTAPRQESRESPAAADSSLGSAKSPPDPAAYPDPEAS